MPRPRLLLDSDGILTDFVGPALDVLCELTGNAYAREQVDQWDMMRALSIPKDVEQEAWRRFKQQGWCYALPIFDGAKEGVARLREIVDLYIVTSPMGGDYWVAERERSLHEHFDIPRRHILPVSDKHVIAGDILVDDKTVTLVAWGNHFPGLTVQWQNPHNVNDDWAGLATKDWNELCGMVRGYAAARARAA